MLNQLGKICGKERTVPMAMLIEPASVHYLSTSPEFGGESGDVYRGEYEGRRVAIKVARLTVTCDLDRRISVRALLHKVRKAPGLSAPFVGVLHRGDHVEAPATSKYSTVFWRDDRPASVEIRVGVKVDGEWSYQ